MRPYIYGVLGSVLFAMWASGIVKSTPLTVVIGPAFMGAAVAILLVRAVMTRKEVA